MSEHEKLWAELFQWIILGILWWKAWFADRPKEGEDDGE